MRKLSLTIIGLLFSTFLFASGGDPKPDNVNGQYQEPGGSPDFPGRLMVDFGFNQLLNAPSDMNLNFLGSRVFNIYYLYELRLGDSRFSFNPGIGIGTEKFAFQNDVTLQSDPVPNPATVEVVNISAIPALSNADIRRSNLGANYVDIPLELRFHGGRDFRKGFWFALGGRFGVLFDASTKIKYRQAGETKTLKQKENFNLNPIRYGVHARIGVGSFNLFGAYYLNPLFRNNQGPAENNMNVLNFGISFNLF